MSMFERFIDIKLPKKLDTISSNVNTFELYFYSLHQNKKEQNCI